MPGNCDLYNVKGLVMTTLRNPRAGGMVHAIAFFGLIAFAGPAWSYLVQNSTFDSDLAGWTQVGGTWVHRPDDGIFGLGAAETTSDGAGSSSINQCGDLTAEVGQGHGLYAFGFGRTVNHTNAVLISLELYATDDCSGPAITTQQFQVFTFNNNWAFAHTVGTAPPGAARSARLWATAFSSAAGEITRIDALGLVENAHINPDFSFDISVWIQNNGIWEHNSSEGYGGPPGAAQVTLGDVDCGAGNNCAFISQCLNLSEIRDTDQLFAGGAFKALDNPGNLVISHFVYPEAGCGGDLLLQAGVGAMVDQVDVWRRFTGDFLVPPGARSVAVFVGANDGDPGDRYLFDSIFLAPPLGVPLLIDGFE